MTEIKLTIKQEKFVQKYLETGNASEAYRFAYTASNMTSETLRVEASRLLNNPNVSLAVKKLQEEARKKHEVTLESITRELEEARILAMTEKQTSSAVSASLGKAKIHGLVVDKKEIKVSPLEDILSEIDGTSTGLPQDQG